jgi:hypothetical protein
MNRLEKTYRKRMFKKLESLKTITFGWLFLKDGAVMQHNFLYLIKWSPSLMEE